MPVDENAERLRALLQSSLKDFLWALDQIPPERQSTPSPRHLERWTATRTLFHLLWYERMITTPTIRQWLGEPPPPFHSQEEDAACEESDWADNDADHFIPTLTAELRQRRAYQLYLLSQLAPTAWDEARDALWGHVTLRWALTKTYQHTIAHTNELLRLALWWEAPQQR